MVTGAASSEAALLLIDAEEGVREQSHRHGYLLHLLGVQQVAVLVNKMDLVDYSADRFGDGRRAVSRLSRRPRGRADRLHPDLGPRGRQHRRALAASCPGTRGRPWSRRSISSPPSRASPTGRCACRSRTSTSSTSAASSSGRIESGRLAVGDKLLFSPSNKTAKVKSIEAWSVPEPPGEARPGSRSGSRSTSRSSSSAAR